MDGAETMIRVNSHASQIGSSGGNKVTELEDQEALDLAADWSDISLGLRKDLGQQLHADRDLDGRVYRQRNHRHQLHESARSEHQPGGQGDAGGVMPSGAPL